MQLVRELLLCRVVLASFGARQEFDPAVVDFGPLIEKSFSTREGGDEPERFLKVLCEICVVARGLSNVPLRVEDVNAFVVLPSPALDL